MVFISEKVAAALQFQQVGRLPEAEQVYREVIAADPNNAAAWHLLGTTLCQSGQNAGAIACIEQALRIEPCYPEALNNLGLVFAACGESERAIASFQRAIERNSIFPEAYLNLGNALNDQLRLDEAMICYRRVIELKPSNPDALSNLAGVLKELGRMDEAIEYYRQALQIEPSARELNYNLGVALWETGEIAAAVDFIRRAIDLSPNYAQAHHALSMLLLLQGDFSDGWAEYEWRWQTGHLQARAFTQPLWDGRSLRDKTIVLHTEQGFGDTIQFIRYASAVKNWGGTVIVNCEKELVPLLSTCSNIDRIIARPHPLPPLDVHAPLLSLPRILRTTLNTIPREVPYLFADPSLVESWRTKLNGISGFRIGINWKGKPRRDMMRQRDINPNFFARLTDIPGIQLISLQKDSGLLELPSLPMPHSIVDLGDFDAACGAFMDTAAVMMSLDLVITSDTSIAHLAGALGVPVWVALPYVPDWRWLLDRSDSLWYPTMRLFRQKQPGDWAGVFEAIQKALRERASR
jgi:tetratricopeptide (TPR) repeat protein